MKIDPIFEVQNNKLYLIGGDEISLAAVQSVNASEFAANPDTVTEYITFVNVNWTDVGVEDSYNEEFLANLRDALKVLEEKQRFVIMNPVFADGMGTAEDFTASMKHCARRIKDCVSVIGFEVPDVCNTESFVEELSAKHGHYIFFNGGVPL